MEDGVILVGRKDFSRYLMALSVFHNKGNKEIVIKARGNNMVMAINLAEYAKREFGMLLPINENHIAITSETFHNNETGRNNHVSAISLTLVRSPK